MEAREALKESPGPAPADPSDQSAEGPFVFLADPVSDSVIGHVHPEEDNIREELVSALKDEFSSTDPESEYHKKLLLGLRLVGFGLNPDYESDPENEDLLVLEDEKKFQEEFFRNNPGFRFPAGEYLVRYILSFAEAEINKPSSMVRDQKLGEFLEWYGQVEAAARVDK